MADPVIKIHENFIISDGTSSSAFTTGDADYTPNTFAAKLSADLAGNTVTFGATGGSGYLEFANSATLTGMPNYIFAIQSSDFLVKAGGRVNFRNVNLDADMTIDITKPFLSQSQIGEDIVGLVSDENFAARAKLNNDGTILVSSAPLYDSNRGRVIVYKYKIPTSTEWNTADIVMKGTDTTPDPDKFYWTRRGAPLTGKNSGDSFGASISIDDTGNFIVISALSESKTNSDGTSNQSVGSLRVYEYKIPTSTEWDNADIYKDSDTNLESGKFYWTQVGNTIFGDDDTEAWGYGASMNNDGSFISWCTRNVVQSGDGRPRLRVYQRDLTNTTTGWTQVGDTIFKDDTENSGGYGYTQQLNDAGDIILINDQFYKTGGFSNAGAAFVYKYKIPTNTEWGTTNMVMKGGDTSQFTNKFYWTKIGEFSGYTSGAPIYSEGAAMNKTGSRVAFTCRKTDTGGGEGQIEVFEYSGSGTTWNQIGDIRGSVGITGASGKITSLKGADLAMNSTGNIIAFSGREHNVDGVTKPGIIGIAEYKNGNWEYIGNDIIGLNADDRLGATISIGGNKVAVGSSRFNGDSDGTYIGRGIVQVYQIEEQPSSNTTTISSGNYFINNFVSTIETGLVNYVLSYDAPNKRIIFNGISTNIEISITSTDTTVFDTSITEITSSNNTLPFITYGEPEPNYRQDAVIFFGTIKIHENFTISDGTSSSAFTTGDADYTQITFANKLSADLAGNTITFGATGGSGFLEFANAATLTGMPNYIFAIPFSDFSVKAGGRVDFRNVNLDAEMTIATTTASSTLPAGDSFINNFVSKISTDINQSLSYDADNKNITFDGISENIEISITSTDTTVFDTSITEITAIEKTLPFITYGEPETSYFQYSLNGITYDEFIASGITSTELLSTGVIPGWSTETDANQFDKSYVLGFMDVSGYMAIRNDCDMVVMGNSTIDGTINMQEDKTLSSSILSVDSRLFANGDISANGKLYVGSDLSVNGEFSSNFAGNSIPYSKIKDSPIITGNVKIGEDVSFNGPTVELGSGATLKLSGTTEFNDNTVFDVNSIRFSGTIVSGNMVFKDTTITDVVVNGSATATTVTSSDYRIKSNVTELNETHTVDTLEPIYYENTLTGNHEYGLIAHELQAEYPDLVINEKDGDEYQSVHYDGLIGVLVKEIQDLKKRLNVLNNT
jgi:hypothetical protein